MIEQWRRLGAPSIDDHSQLHRSIDCEKFHADDRSLPEPLDDKSTVHTWNEEEVSLTSLSIFIYFNQFTFDFIDCRGRSSKKIRHRCFWLRRQNTPAMPSSFSVCCSFYRTIWMKIDAEIRVKKGSTLLYFRQVLWNSNAGGWKISASYLSFFYCEMKKNVNIEWLRAIRNGDES